MDELPNDLIAVLLAYEDDSDWLPPQGSPGLRAMIKTDGGPTKDDFKWIAEQREKQNRARIVHQRLIDNDPLPTYTEIIEAVEDVTYPEWQGTTWAETLVHPWAQNLEEAISSAEEYLESKESS